ncbi:hypothetical protein CQY20_25870 [Mycolicibacterium agri]|uniref:Translation initiation factor IF-2 N-terminal domain-containing protein n=1 Tax=Mycolicibacterium agri TaxID=36811 RepID=A0A2A7MRD5_MYCAG|nr:translation initiation factor IF-2 N-terminal domain-containing protein [Mycolicibacterium agri]PEG34372.1 hypothetical protein CQY20_25870 [Mycolicibacterium agri]GFG52346.1 hypothetical protein MAGR_37870 [Mycolicibacterium agri]
MAGKTRVHQLAKELGVTTKEILAALAEHGESVETASAVLSAPVVRRLREVYEEAKSAPPKRGEPGRKARAPMASQEPPHAYLRERNSNVVHHKNYLKDRSDQTLCGLEDGFGISDREPDGATPECQACQSRLAEYHAKWWRRRCLATDKELRDLQQRYRKLEQQLNRQRYQLSRFQQQWENRRKGVRKKSGSAQAAKPKQRRTPANSGKRRTTKVVSPRVADPKIVGKRVQEMLAPRPPKSLKERWADEAAADLMRSQKPSSWRLGRSPASFG